MRPHPIERQKERDKEREIRKKMQKIQREKLSMIWPFGIQ